MDGERNSQRGFMDVWKEEMQRVGVTEEVAGIVSHDPLRPFTGTAKRRQNVSQNFNMLSQIFTPTVQALIFIFINLISMTL